MFAFATAILIGAGMGLRLGLPVFLTTMFPAVAATIVVQCVDGSGVMTAALSGMAMLIALQSGYVGGVLVRALREDRPRKDSLPPLPAPVRQ